MSVSKLYRGSVPAVKPRMFKPTLNSLPCVTESGWYDLHILSAKESTVLVLYGTPSRTDEDGNVEIFRNTPICVSQEYFEDEITPVESLFDAMGFDMDQSVDLNSLKGQKVCVYINVSLNTATGSTYWNGLAFEA